MSVAANKSSLVSAKRRERDLAKLRASGYEALVSEEKSTFEVPFNGSIIWLFRARQHTVRGWRLEDHSIPAGVIPLQKSFGGFPEQNIPPQCGFPVVLLIMPAPEQSA